MPVSPVPLPGVAQGTRWPRTLGVVAKLLETQPEVLGTHVQVCDCSSRGDTPPLHGIKSNFSCTITFFNFQHSLELGQHSLNLKRGGGRGVGRKR